MTRPGTSAVRPPARNPGPPTAAQPTSAAPMWWDGGERAITAREKATIEEHGASCFSIPLVPAIPFVRCASCGDVIQTCALLGTACRCAYGSERSRAHFEVLAGSLFTGEGVFDGGVGWGPGWEYCGNEVQTAWARWQAAVENLLTECVPGGGIVDPQVVADNIRAWAAKRKPAELAEQHVGEIHPDEVAVDAFAAKMKAKMADARAKGRGGWEDREQCSAEDLSRTLREHVEKGDPRDVANFCMMLHQRGEAIAAQVGEVQGDAVANPGVIVGTLRAMARNYSGGHCWDQLDAPMCRAAADRIEMLEAALAATGKQQVGEVQGDADRLWPELDRLLVDAYNAGTEGDEFDILAARKTLIADTAARQPGAQVSALTFAAFRNANVSRCEKWHPEGIGSWSPSDWLTAAMGELGELASEVKMHNRVRDGLAGNKEQITTEERTRRMANEAADVVTYLDLFCAERGIDLGAALVRKFNEVSERVGFPDRLDPAAAQGIDLEKARDEGHDGAIRYVLGYLNGVGDWGSTQYVEILNACGRERIIQSAVQDGELEFTGLGRWVAERGTDKDRALIDQRDAAPGVTP